MPVSQASAITCHSARRRAIRERLPAVGKSFSSEDVATGRATLTRVALVGGGDQDDRDEASVWGGGWSKQSGGGLGSGHNQDALYISMKLSKNIFTF